MSTIHIACAADERYLPHCAAMLHSVFATTAGRDIVVHFTHFSDFPAEQLEKLTTFVNDLGGRLDAVRISENLLELPHTADYPTVVWQRVLLPQLLPRLDKVLYIDSDVIALGSLQPLWDLNIDDYYLAAVTNPMDDDMASWPMHIGLPDPSAYFNNGIMLMNLERMREHGATDKIVRHGVDHPNLVHWPEQCAMNAILHAGRYPLHPRWNVMNNFLILGRGEGLFAAGALAEALADPQLLHFEGATQSKPWHYRSDHPYRAAYLRHRKQTPWPLVQLEGRTPANFIKKHLIPSRLLTALRRVRHGPAKRPGAPSTAGPNRS